MKRLVTSAALFLSLLGMGAFADDPHDPPTREERWGLVEKALDQGLPKTAAEHLPAIIEGAMADGAHAEATRAIVQMIVGEGMDPVERAAQLHHWIEISPAEMQPMLWAIQAC